MNYIDLALGFTTVLSGALALMLLSLRMKLANKERAYELDSLRRSTWEQVDQILDRIDRLERRVEGCCEANKGT